MGRSPGSEAACLQPLNADDLESVLDGQRRSFGRILGRFGIPVEDAEDLLQEVICHFLLKRPEVHSPEPWLRSVLRNRCRLYWRKRLGSEEMRERAIACGLALSADIAGSPEGNINTRLDLARALARLPRSKRDLLLCHDVEGENSRELAQRFDYQETSIRKTVARLHERLRANLAPHGYDRIAASARRREVEP